MGRLHEWHVVQRYHDEGHNFVQCQREFGFSHTAWVKAIRRGELIARFRRDGENPICPDDRRRIHDWCKIQEYYDAGHSLRECQQKFKFTTAAWYKARLRGEITPRPPGMPLSELMRRGISRYNVKMRLIRAGLLKAACQMCGLTEWRGNQLSLHIDHINGVKNDHRLGNLRMLCPNCHSQTETYGGRNIRRGRLQEDREVT